MGDQPQPYETGHIKQKTISKETWKRDIGFRKTKTRIVFAGKLRRVWAMAFGNRYCYII